MDKALQDKVAELKLQYDSVEIFIGTIKPLGKGEFQFKYNGDFPIQCFDADCWCTDVSWDKENQVLSGVLSTTQATGYRENPQLYVDAGGNPFQVAQHASKSYYFPLVGGNAVEKTPENDAKFKKFEGALESKQIKVFYDDGEDFYKINENFVREENTNKLQHTLKIQGLVDLS